MTTKEAEQRYRQEHNRKFADLPVAVYNPHNRPIEELPYILGFNNGGSERFLHAQLIAEDGKALGSHICSHEDYMPHDLGILEGTRPDLHEGFKTHYPDGYRMAFVDPDDKLLLRAIAKHYQRNIEVLEQVIKDLWAGTTWGADKGAVLEAHRHVFEDLGLSGDQS